MLCGAHHSAQSQILPVRSSPPARLSCHSRRHPPPSTSTAPPPPAAHPSPALALRPARGRRSSPGRADAEHRPIRADGRQKDVTASNHRCAGIVCSARQAAGVTRLHFSGFIDRCPSRLQRASSAFFSRCPLLRHRVILRRLIPLTLHPIMILHQLSSPSERSGDGDCPRLFLSPTWYLPGLSFMYLTWMVCPPAVLPSNRHPLIDYPPTLLADFIIPSSLPSTRINISSI